MRKPVNAWIHLAVGCLTVAAPLLGAAVCFGEEPQPAPQIPDDVDVSYTLYINIERAEGAKELSAKEMRARNVLLLEVNEIPRMLCAVGKSADFICLNQWLNPGKNTLRISGTHKDPVHLKIKVRSLDVSYDPPMGYREFGAAANFVFEPAQESKTVEFEIKLPSPKIDAEELDLSKEGKTQIEKEIASILRKLETAQNEQDKATLEKMAKEYFLPGKIQWLESRGYHCGFFMFLAENHAKDILYYGPRVADPDGPKPLKFVYGKRGVFVYRGVEHLKWIISGSSGGRYTDEDPFPRQAYLYFFNDSDGTRTAAPALTFIKRNNKWEAWEAPNH